MFLVDMFLVGEVPTVRTQQHCLGFNTFVYKIGLFFQIRISTHRDSLHLYRYKSSIV